MGSVESIVSILIDEADNCVCLCKWLPIKFGFTMPKKEAIFYLIIEDSTGLRALFAELFKFQVYHLQLPISKAKEVHGASAIGYFLVNCLKSVPEKLSS
nr:hypothetical protein CFP56_46072 [Quercus suber]